MEKRVLLSIFLAFLVLYAWQALFVKPVPKVTPGAAETAALGAPANAAPASVTAQSSEQPPAPPKAPASEALVAESAERDIRVETRDVIAIFTNRGARLKSWRLKHYLDQQKQPQELVVSQLASQPLPFTLRTPSDATTETLNSALFTVSGERVEAAESSSIDLRFEYSDRGGLHAVKEFHLEPSSYLVTFRATVAEGDRAVTPTILWGPGVGDLGELSRYVTKAEGLSFASGGKVSRLAPSDIAKQSVYDGTFAFVGVDDNYFMAVALSPGPSKVTFQPVSIPPPAGSKDEPRVLVAYSIEPQQAGAIKFFAGPKDFDVLAGIGTDVTRAINFGMFAVLVVPLLRSLKWVNNYVGNYGWAIIILTIMINALMFPLRHKSVVSMRKMQEIQPEVKAIQDRYSKLKNTDPAKANMNKEMMALYRDKGVNPASGCVPMLLTFPLIFAFYALLSTAIELRGAPFIWWIHDLSSRDPYYVTPILMGISQMWQQRIAPQTGVDPAQQKMMMLMPIVFTFMFVSAPSGVALYWLISNLWAIGQQYATNYIIGPPKVRAVRPPGSSKVKHVGVGKTEAAARES